jgi:hypothetical protein
MDILSDDDFVLVNQRIQHHPNEGIAMTSRRRARAETGREHPPVGWRPVTIACS